jgi:hypothetical protein
MFHADARTDRQTMTEVIAAFRNYAKAPNKRRPSIPSAGFEPVIPAIEQLQTYALDRTSTGIGLKFPLCDYKPTSVWQ